MTHPLAQLLLALFAVIVVGRLLAKVFAYIGQPPVIGEVVAGILLGPSLLGSEVSSYVLPTSVAANLGMVAHLGVVLYMFLVGLELNAGLLRSRGLATAIISQASIAAPFCLGAGLAFWLYPALAGSGATFPSFALFLGVAMSITAFPVLARILADRGIAKTELGVLALACAAINDVTAWCLLAVVVGVATAEVESALVVMALAAAYIACVIVFVRPLAVRVARRYENTEYSAATLAGVLAAVLLSALVTDQFGIHAIFGAFLLGAVIPHDSRLARETTARLHDVVTVLLLPAFFAYTGMRTEIGLLATLDQWLWTGLIILVATVGKFGGAFVAARCSGFDTRTSASLGALMNTRGLMELIVLNVGLDLGVISPTLFAMMVLMALVTTLATTPMLHLFTPLPASRKGAVGERNVIKESPAVSGSAS